MGVVFVLPSSESSDRVTNNRPLAFVLLFVLSASMLGCGTAAYEEKAAASLEKYQKETGFDLLWKDPVADFKEKTFSIRLPKVFDESANALNSKSPEPQDSEIPLEHANRIQPSYLNLPGHQRTYEIFRQGKNAKTRQPTTAKGVYCYLAVYKPKKKHSESNERMREKLQAQLKKRFSETTTDWTEVKLRTPEGAEITWHRLTASGDQRFHYYPTKGGVDYKITDGEYHLYFGTFDGKHVMVGWRIPRDIETETLDVLHLAHASIGTVKIAEE